MGFTVNFRMLKSPVPVEKLFSMSGHDKATGRGDAK